MCVCVYISHFTYFTSPFSFVGSLYISYTFIYAQVFYVAHTKILNITEIGRQFHELEPEDQIFVPENGYFILLYFSDFSKPIIRNQVLSDVSERHNFFRFLMIYTNYDDIIPDTMLEDYKFGNKVIMNI